MLSILSTRRFARWTALFKTWLKQQLDAIAESIDFGPVEEKIDEVENKIGVADVVDLGLPVIEGSGFCAIYDDGDIKVIDSDVTSPSTENYKVGSIIKPITYGEEYEDYVVPKTVSSNPTDIWWDSDEEWTLYGVLTYITWEVGKYYRVTGIYDCYNEDKTEVIDHIFTYEEVSEETVAKLINSLADNRYATTSDVAEMDAEILIPYE